MINGKKAYNYFSSHFEMTESSRGWYRFQFPFDNHKDKSAGVHFLYGVVKDHRSGYQSGIVKFVAEYEQISYSEAKKLLGSYDEVDIIFKENTLVERKPFIEYPDGFKHLMEGEEVIGQRARKYLSRRGFDVESLDSMGFGYVDDNKSKFWGYIIVPYKSQGKLIYYTGRDFMGNYIKYQNPEYEQIGIGKDELVFNEDALWVYDKVYMQEGWADALTIGVQGIATSGWSLSQRQFSTILKSPVKEIIIVPDKGKIERSESTFFQKAIQTGLKFLPHKKIKVIDVNQIEEPGKDVNEWGKELIMEMESETEFLTYKLASKYA